MKTVLDPGAVVLDRIATLEVERTRVEARIAAVTQSPFAAERGDALAHPPP